MKADYNAMDDAGFREMVRDFVEAECPPHLRNQPRRMRRREVESWSRKLVAKGWVAPNWPAEHGGMGLSVAKQLAFREEFDRLGVPRIPDAGVLMLGPLLIRFGTDAQRARFLPPITRAEEVWCQGYSEPNSGSDLASLRTEAVLDGDHWIINGQKIWITHAQDSDWIFLLARSDKTAKKQAGISFLLADMKTPGITVRPIRTLTGDDDFCEVFFDNVRIPKDNLVGNINEGWTMAKALLGFERISVGSPKLPQVALMRLDVLARATGAIKDERFIDRYAELQLDIADLAESYAGFIEKLKRGETLGPEVSLLKVVATTTYQRITELVVETSAEQGAIEGPVTYGNESVDALRAFFLSRASTIYSGSNEIQRNILAKAVLKLPDA